MILLAREAFWYLNSVESADVVFCVVFDCVCVIIFLRKKEEILVTQIIPWNFSQNSLYVTSKQDLCHSQSDLEVASF